MSKSRHVFFLSDRTGITAETLGNGLLTQFDGIDFIKATKPFINTPEKAQAMVEYIGHVAEDSGVRPLVFSTTVSDEIRTILRGANGFFLDLFDTFVPSLETELGAESVHKAPGCRRSDPRGAIASRQNASQSVSGAATRRVRDELSADRRRS